MKAVAVACFFVLASAFDRKDTLSLLQTSSVKQTSELRHDMAGREECKAAKEDRKSKKAALKAAKEAAKAAKAAVKAARDAFKDSTSALELACPKLQKHGDITVADCAPPDPDAEDGRGWENKNGQLVKVNDVPIPLIPCKKGVWQKGEGRQRNRQLRLDEELGKKGLATTPAECLAMVKENSGPGGLCDSTKGWDAVSFTDPATTPDARQGLSCWCEQNVLGYICSDGSNNWPHYNLISCALDNADQ
jgi:hypothetical protein